MKGTTLNPIQILKWWKAGVAIALSTLCAHAFAADFAGEVTRVSKRRTVVTIELRGDTALEAGDKLVVETKDGAAAGTIRKITENGKAIVRLRQPLAESVGVGTDVKLKSEGGSEPSAPVVTAGKKVKLSRGGFKKLYWDEVSYLAAHRRAGTRVDLEVGYLSAAGNSSRKGGSIEEDADFETTDKRLQFSTTAGYIPRGGFGGGLQLAYDDSDREATAEITTEATASVDQDKEETSKQTTELRPYVAYLDRPTTGDLGYGVGLSVPIRMTKQERKITIAGEVGDSSPSETNETGISIDALVGSNTWAVIFGISPGVAGKVKSEGQEDVDREFVQYSAHYECYQPIGNLRVGLTYSNGTDKYPSGDLKEKLVKIATALDFRVASVNVIPLVEYTSIDRTLGDRTGDGSETELGARVALSGKYAPFVSLNLNLRSEDETLRDSRKVERATSGVRVAGGISI
jgi:hypothetical protein